jgi:transcription antitermination factor NusG
VIVVKWPGWRVLRPQTYVWEDIINALDTFAREYFKDVVTKGSRVTITSGNFQRMTGMVVETFAERREVTVKLDRPIRTAQGVVEEVILYKDWLRVNA